MSLKTRIAWAVLLLGITIIAFLAARIGLREAIGHDSPSTLAGLCTPITCTSGTVPGDSVTTSRARYLNARSTLDRAWGDWNIAFHDPDAGRYFVIIGIDTRERCDATVKILTEHFKGREGAFAQRVAVCYESIGKGDVP